MAKGKKRSSPGGSKKGSTKHKTLPPELMEEKKKYVLLAGKDAVARGSLRPEDIATSRTEARVARSGLFGGRRGLGIVWADMDPTDSIRILDTDPVDRVVRIDHDARDPLPPGW